MWMQLASAVLGSGVLNAPEGGGIPPSMITGPTSGDWNVNLGGSGTALQSGAGGVSPFLMIGGIVLVAIWLLKK